MYLVNQRRNLRGKLHSQDNRTAVGKVDAAKSFDLWYPTGGGVYRRAIQPIPGTAWRIFAFAEMRARSCFGAGVLRRPSSRCRTRTADSGFDFSRDLAFPGPGSKDLNRLYDQQFGMGPQSGAIAWKERHYGHECRHQGADHIGFLQSKRRANVLPSLAEGRVMLEGIVMAKKYKMQVTYRPSGPVSEFPKTGGPKIDSNIFYLESGKGLLTFENLRIVKIGLPQGSIS